MRKKTGKLIYIANEKIRGKNENKQIKQKEGNSLILTTTPALINLTLQLTQ